MNNLWAPWRMKYIQGIDGTDEGCIFCTKPQQGRDRENLILLHRPTCFVIMNLYPYNNGHLMVVPRRHTSTMADLESAELLELWDTVRQSVTILTNAIKADGFNVGLNLGRAAGAGIDQHIHVHIVPRWNGDTNFMPVVGETKVISQSLGDTYDTLLPGFNALEATA